MNIKQIALAVVASALPAVALAETKTVDGVGYLLSMPKDMSQDFLDFSNTYFFADSLATFDTATGQGKLQWKRHQVMPLPGFQRQHISAPAPAVAGFSRHGLSSGSRAGIQRHAHKRAHSACACAHV